MKKLIAILLLGFSLNLSAASLTELRDAAGDSGLINKVHTALLLKAWEVKTETYSVGTNKPSRQALADTMKDAESRNSMVLHWFLWAMLYENRAATLSQILNANDTAIQNNVTSAFDAVAGVKD